jgi:N-dimethylarginine dimethylaminohydrolase
MAMRFLVCPPANPAPSGVRDRQWSRFVEMLECTGDVTFVEMKSRDDVPDLTFTADAALVYGKLAILSSFRHPERRRAQSIFRNTLSEAGLATTYLCNTYFEAADVLLDRARPMCYAGYGWRTERSAVLQLHEIVGCRVLPLLLVDERFFHLNMALCPLASGHVLAYMNAFSPHAQALLRRAIGAEQLIEIEIDDALDLVCNAVEVGSDALIMHRTSRALRERLNDAGYRVFCTDLDEFIRAGGSAKSLALQLDHAESRSLIAS